MTDVKCRALSGAFRCTLTELRTEWSSRPESCREIARIWNAALEAVYPGGRVRVNHIDVFRLLGRRDQGGAGV